MSFTETEKCRVLELIISLILVNVVSVENTFSLRRWTFGFRLTQPSNCQRYDSIASCFSFSSRCSPSSKTWHDVAPMYTQRCYVSTAVAHGCIYALGGYDGQWRLSSAERYSPTTNQWSQLEPMLQRRSDAGSDSLHGQCGTLLHLLISMIDELPTAWGFAEIRRNVTRSFAGCGRRLQRHSFKRGKRAVKSF
jgi:hypothetical protein